ncbi:response regulator transcription factor [Arthrobacter sp.]|uniref:response regulator n=1 Tax=Arthrobacter sp. TaxID=1667 RepID=UPI0026E075B1|nr:response regulator transcription factor [Arthrobacter sp.]MDO5754098.1 response regulator transcription factor [Arthrobacter sp.]
MESSERRIAVLLVDDHAAIRLGMRMVVDTAMDMSVVGEAGDGATAITMARALVPDVILMDLRMPVLDGVKATETICAEGLSKVLVLTTFDHDSYLFGALRAGAAGFLLKSAEPAGITDAIRRVDAGQQVIAPEVTARIVAAALTPGNRTSQHPAPELDTLTARERDVFEALGKGLTNYSIGRQLGISEATVKTHVSRVLAKLGLESRVQAALLQHHRHN